MNAAIDAIDYICKNVDARSWCDAAEKLQQRETLVPALLAQLHQAESAEEIAEQVERAAEAGYKTSTLRWQDADGLRRAFFSNSRRREHASWNSASTRRQSRQNETHGSRASASKPKVEV